MTSAVIFIVVIVVLIILSALFSSAETALTTIPAHRLRTMVSDGVKGAVRLEKILAERQKMLSVILICNNIVNLSASAVMTILVQKLFGNGAVSIGTGVLTLLVLIFGEIAPKTFATYRAEKLALKISGIIYGLMVVFTPIAAAVNFLARGVLRLMGIKKDEETRPITEKEFLSLVEVSNEQGVIENDEKNIIDNVFEFSDTVVKEVMVPRINVTSIREDSTYEEIMPVFRQNYYTRLPVFDEDEENIIGVLNVKDLVFYDEEKISEFSVKSVMREIKYTFEQKHLSELFLEMKNENIAMMAVLDEYGDTAGIVTLEDLIEEILGDIRDEYDESESEELVEMNPGEYLAHGHMGLSDVNDILGTGFESEDYDSIGGILIEALGRLPEPGESVKIGNAVLTAQEMENARIEKVKIEIFEKETEEDNG